jgi:hypothetical protein
MKVLGVVLVLGGCATSPDIWDRPYTSQSQFNNDAAGCKLVAMTIPKQQTQVDTYRAETVSYGNRATTTVGPDPYAKLGAVIGDAITNSANAKTAVRLCMQSKGYRLRPKS